MFETKELFTIPTTELTVKQLFIIGNSGVENLEIDRGTVTFTTTETNYHNICEEHGINQKKHIRPQVLNNDG